MPVAAMRAQSGSTPILYVQTTGGGNCAECYLLAPGFYYRHILKWQKNVCVKTLDDVILDLRVEVLTPREYLFSNTRHSVQSHQQESLSMPPTHQYLYTAEIQ